MESWNLFESIDTVTVKKKLTSDDDSSFTSEDGPLTPPKSKLPRIDDNNNQTETTSSSTAPSTNLVQKAITDFSVNSDDLDRTISGVNLSIPTKGKEIEPTPELDQIDSEMNSPHIADHTSKTPEPISYGNDDKESGVSNASSKSTSHLDKTQKSGTSTSSRSLRIRSTANKRNTSSSTSATTKDKRKDFPLVHDIADVIASNGAVSQGTWTGNLTARHLTDRQMGALNRLSSNMNAFDTLINAQDAVANLMDDNNVKHSCFRIGCNACTAGVLKALTPKIPQILGPSTLNALLNEIPPDDPRNAIIIGLMKSSKFESWIMKICHEMCKPILDQLKSTLTEKMKSTLEASATMASENIQQFKAFDRKITDNHDKIRANMEILHNEVMKATTCSTTPDEFATLFQICRNEGKIPNHVGEDEEKKINERLEYMLAHFLHTPAFTKKIEGIIRDVSFNPSEFEGRCKSSDRKSTRRYSNDTHEDDWETITRREEEEKRLQTHSCDNENLNTSTSDLRAKEKHPHNERFEVNYSQSATFEPTTEPNSSLDRLKSYCATTDKIEASCSSTRTDDAVANTPEINECEKLQVILNSIDELKEQRDKLDNMIRESETIKIATKEKYKSLREQAIRRTWGSLEIHDKADKTEKPSASE